MDSFATKKEDYVAKISIFMLNEGISACSLKRMAQAAVTSDRMLMHYFRDKDEIMNLGLSRISENMITMLSSHPNMKMTFKDFAPFLLSSLKNEQFKPYLDIWFELIHLATTQGEPYKTISKEIGDTYWTWLIRTLIADDDEQVQSQAALLFAFVEGLVLLDKMGMQDKMDLATEALLKMLK